MRARLLIEADLIQARDDFLRHDAELDPAQADSDYRRMDDLLDEWQQTHRDR